MGTDHTTMQGDKICTCSSAVGIEVFSLKHKWHYNYKNNSCLLEQNVFPVCDLALTGNLEVGMANSTI